MHVFVGGLDPVAASVACLLAAAGVCLLTVCDPAPVSPRDIRHGPYPAESEGRPRELVLRGVLRRSAPRCVPLSAPELFPTAALPGTVVLNSWQVAGELVQDLRGPDTTVLDAALPTVTVVTDGATVLRWPFTDWGHRPCAPCLLAAVRQARRRVRHGPATPGTQLLPGPDAPVGAATRAVAAGELAGLLVVRGLGLDGAAAGETPGAAPVGGPVMRRGLTMTPLPPNPECLCSLAFEAP
ncbi:hypothetical protein C1C97_003625 [Kocuria tytonis]|uniref:THIF-type NAD/FAD binding fold domain-containing protein n=1 Tax=Kocuria tytonis TaxID=2054280 RepID=A0A495ABH4_9MICC|nr:hypothetical protein C1C97_003625 [Kocuria tytonis]